MSRQTASSSLSLVLCLSAVTAWTQAPTPDAAVKRVMDDPKFKAAMAAIDRDHDRLVAEIITADRDSGAAVQGRRARRGLSRDAARSTA